MCVCCVSVHALLVKKFSLGMCVHKKKRRVGPSPLQFGRCTTHLFAARGAWHIPVRGREEDSVDCEPKMDKQKQPNTIVCFKVKVSNLLRQDSALAT